MTNGSIKDVRKREVLFVGAFREKLADARIGGQAFASASLRRALEADGWKVYALDSSINRITDRGKLNRLLPAVKRISRFIWICMTRRPTAALIFSSAGLSLLEKAALGAIARTFGIRSVLFPRSGLVELQFRSSAVFRRVAAFLMQRCTFVACQSSRWRSFFLESGVAPEKLVVVENWLPATAFIATDAPVAFSGGEHFVIGYFSRVEVEKGIFDFLEAFEQLYRRSPNARAIIYGDGSAVKRVEEWVRSRGMVECVRYGGWLSPEAKIDRLRKLDACVFASHYEGFPNSLLELAALKVPIVSVVTGSVSDFLVDRVSARLVPIGNVVEIAEALYFLMLRPSERARIACEAYKRVASENTENVALKKLRELLS